MSKKKIRARINLSSLGLKIKRVVKKEVHSLNNSLLFTKKIMMKKKMINVNPILLFLISAF